MLTRSEWITKCLSWKERWPVQGEQGPELNCDKFGINLYKFYEILNQNLKEDSVVTWDAGSVLYCSNQMLHLNGEKQRSVGSLSQAEMGAALGIASGVSFARNKGEVVCCVGDGSFNTNPQALAVIRHFNLPIKIFVLNNSGFLSIRNTQDKFYDGRRMGTDSEDGYFFPKIENIAKAYEIEYMRVSLICNLDHNIKEMLKYSGPIICEVICQKSQEILPAITASKTKEGKLEQNDFSQMYPFLSEKEYESEMVKL